MPRIKRPHSIVVKVTAEERDAFYRASSKLKLSGSDWLRGLGMVEVMDKPVELEGPSDMGNPITEPSLNTTPVVESPINSNGTPKPPIPAEQRMYQVIAAKQGKAAADAWLKSRQKPAPVVIGEPQVPGHLKLFYESLKKMQGDEAARLWLITNTSGKKISL